MDPLTQVHIKITDSVAVFINAFPFRMKKSFLCVATVLLAVPFSASAGFYNVFKTSIMIPVVYVDPVTHKPVTKTIATKDFVNLTLGRPLNTAPDTKILVLKLDFEDSTEPGQPPPTPETTLVIWDTAIAGDATVDKTFAVAATLTELDFDVYGPGTTTKGQGIAAAVIPEGTADPTGNNKFFAVTLRGSGSASQPATPLSAGINVMNSAGLKVVGMSGRVHFKFTDLKKPTVPAIEISGVALKGSLTTTGKSIAHFHD